MSVVGETDRRLDVSAGPSSLQRHALLEFFDFSLENNNNNNNKTRALKCPETTTFLDVLLCVFFFFASILARTFLPVTTGKKKRIITTVSLWKTPVGVMFYIDRTYCLLASETG